MMLLLGKGCLGDLDVAGMECNDDHPCPSGYFCNLVGDKKVCEQEAKGGQDQPCYEDGACDDDLVCKAQNICGQQEARGGEGQPCYDDGTCDVDLVCNWENICEREAVNCCVEDQHIWISGTVWGLLYPGPVPVALVIREAGPAAAVGNLTETFSNNSGAFQTDCFEVPEAPDRESGLVTVTDDAVFDGVHGVFLPTVTGVVDWTDATDKTCIQGVGVYALENALVVTLSEVSMGPVADSGLVMGYVLDPAGNPVEGAVVEKADNGQMPPVFYPDPSFEDFSGAATSSTGIYIIPGPLSETRVKPDKWGLTFSSDYLVHASPDMCLVVNMQAD